MTKTITYKASGTMTSNCTCYYCDKCEVTVFHDGYCPECDNCETGLTPNWENCSGGCWDEMVSDFEEFGYKPWTVANMKEEFAIYGRNVNWNRSSGHTGRLTEFEQLMKNLTLNGDFTLRWELSEDNETLTVCRSSHDEMGAMFEVVVWNEGDDE